MDTNTAVLLLGALAQPARLNIFRLLIQAGEAGLSAGVIGARLALPNSTLSFHLKALQQAGLILPRPNSRFIYYAAHYDQMTQLIQFLTAHCCLGEACDLTDAASISSCDAQNFATAPACTSRKTTPHSASGALTASASATAEMAQACECPPMTVTSATLLSQS